MPATNALLQEGRYRINNEFPDEGIGSVYDAYDTVSETNVVVKEIPVKLNKVATISQRENLNIAFADHAKVLTEIKHESILHVRDYFSEIGRQYLVMESVEGDDLQALLDRQKGCFPVSDVTGWADQLLDALNYLHTYRTPIVHKNIRPENIKLNSDGKIKIMSFGLNGDREVQAQGGIAETGAEGAGIAYSPLEQIWNGLDAASQKVIISKYDERSERVLKEDLDARSDIYSLGATLYHLITARIPVDSLERSIEILEGRPDPLRSPHKINPNIAPEISDVIIKAMEIKREYRFDSAAIMRQVLRTALVRVKEREDEEACEQAEAAESIREAEQNKIKQTSAAAEQKQREIEAQKESEAEAARLLAEDQAAEAEQRQLEIEAEAARILAEQKAAELEQKRLAIQAEKERKAEAARLLAEQAAEAEQKRLEMEAEKEREAEAARLLAEQQAADAEHERQTELLKEQLREAERQRELAEEKAAEAEEEQQAQLLKQAEREAEAERILAEQRAVEAEELLAKQSAAEEDRLLAEQRAAEIEKELQAQKKKEQEREAETQRLLSEKRAEEAEKLLTRQRAAEEERLLAEQRISEVQKRIEEREADKAAKTKSAKHVKADNAIPGKIDVSDDDLLDILPSANNNAQSAYFDSDEENILLDESVAVKHSSESTPKTEVAAPNFTLKSYDEDLLDEGQSSRRPFGLPAIVIGAAVLIAVAIAVWSFMPSGSSVPNKSAETEAPATNTSAQTAVLPVGETNSRTPDITPAELSPQTSDTDPSLRTAALTAPKTKKPTPTPVKAPTQKKAVTADDLINDN